MKKTFFTFLLIFTLLGCQAPPMETNISLVETKEVEAKIEQKKEELNVESESSINSNLTLIDRGSEPRQELFFRPEVNQVEKLIMTMTMDLKMAVNGEEAPSMGNPKIKIKMGFKVKEIDENNDIHAEFEYEEISLIPTEEMPSEITAVMAQELDKMIGLKGLLIMDQSGNTKLANFSLPETLDPLVAQMIERMLNSLKQLTSPFLTEAVGVGAKWQIMEQVELEGMSLNQQVNYEIMKIEGDQITLGMNFQQLGGDQSLEIPELDLNSLMEISNISSQGGGEILINLNQLMPISSNINTQSNMEMKINEPDHEPLIFKTETKINLLLESQAE